FVEEAGGKGGRRLAVHEFPRRDASFTEDLGRAARRFSVRAYVIGDAYTTGRDALLSACEDYDTPATLVHPWMGEIPCRAGPLSWSESKERGGACAFDIEFIRDDGAGPGPTALADTASTLLAGLASLRGVIVNAYQAASLVLSVPQYVLGLATGLLSQAASAFSLLPQATIAGLNPLIAATTATPGNDAATAIAIGAFMDAAVTQIVTVQSAPPPPDDPVLGSQAPIAPAADISGGLAALAAWGATFPQPTGIGPQQAAQAAQQAAVITLVQGTALAGMLAVYAQTDWTTANAAAAARAQALALIDSEATAAALAGQDALYLAWLAIAAQATTDLIRRAQALPSLVAYALGEATPSLALAQRWYRDPDRAVEIELLNDAPHPLFMPGAGVRLSS
ncbi:MAG: DNA circularization N-terminal domain-containing protein, partial [Acetobacteraceae bacterium]|nr:DNA circularization N-terminal domain-containing protein [Acetobacteraceae bacterium]